MGEINIDNTGSGADVTLSSDGTNLLLGGSAIGGGGGGGASASADLYIANPSSATSPTAGGTNAIGIGDGAVASGNDSISFGSDSTASGNYAISIGENALASNTEDIAIGRNASSTGEIGVAIGHDTKTTGTAGISLNTLSHSRGATGTYSTAIGYWAKATNTRSVAIGAYTHSQGTNAYAMGWFASVYNMGDGANNAFAIGESVDVRAENAFGLGKHTYIPTVKGKYAYSSSRFTSNGDAQSGTFVLRSDTTDATAEALTTNNSTAAANNQITLPNSSAHAFHGTIIARQQAADGTACAAWKVEGLIRREANASTTVLVNSAITVLDNTPNWGLAISADTTNGCLKLQVTGAASTDIRWVATINTSEVTFA